MSKCQGCQEKEASRLECPTCKKLGIPGSFFCDQDCFKKYWSKHKQIHTLVQSLAGNGSAQTSMGADGIPPHLRGFKWTGSLRPRYPLSAKREVPAHIPRPEWADHPQGWPTVEQRTRHKIRGLTPEEIEGMRKVCRLGREVLDICCAAVRPGITTDELDRICHEECIKRDAYPSPLNYRNFPKSVCTSVNEVICHGIPDQRPLEDGDIVNLDVSLFHGGFHGDLNATVPVGNVDAASMELIQTTKRAMEEAISVCKPGQAYREIGRRIEEVVKPKGFSIVRQYTGHGIHTLFHAAPDISHYYSRLQPGKMEVGQTFTIEPMINAGTASLDHWPDDWTAVTKDGKRSAQFEETILITEDGAEYLTRPGWYVKDGKTYSP